MRQERKVINHLIAGGTGGTVGAILTCPLEIVKTRLQSSVSSLKPPLFVQTAGVPHGPHTMCSVSLQAFPDSTYRWASSSSSSRPTYGIIHCLRHMIETEGPRSMFKGLGPNLVGVAPSRAIYFGAYAKSKNLYNTIFIPDSTPVHLCSAATAGSVSVTATNPIWFIKTRLQLDESKNGERLRAAQCIKQIYKQHGLTGFYKGVTASYVGISETMIHFMIYEKIKRKLGELRSKDISAHKSWRDFLEFMCAAAMSKSCASVIAYPHEVARTRLRQEGNKYRTFFQTILTVAREEGRAGVYGGLKTHLIRQIPNVAIMMCVYETVVYKLRDF